MSLDFERGSSEWGGFSSAIASAAPFTFCAWIKPESISVAQTVFAIATSGSANHLFKLDLAASNTMRFRARTSGSSDAITTGTLSAGTWYFVACRAVSATDRSVFLDSEKANNTTSRVPAGMNRTSIARTSESTGATYFDGLIAYPAFWNTNLSDAQLAALAAGEMPDRVQTANLVSYWPFTSTSGGSDDLGSNDLTLTGTTYSSDEPNTYNYSALPVAAVSLDSLAVGAATASGAADTSSIPLALISLDGAAPTATTTENHQSAITTKALALDSLVISAATTEHHQSAVAVQAVALASLTPSATTTEHHQSALELKALSLDKLNPTATTTEHNQSAITNKALSLDSLAIGATTTEASSNTSAIPLKLIAVDKLAINAATTEHNQSLIPLATATLQSYAVTANTSDYQASALPVKELSLVAYAPTATTTEKNYSAITTAAIELTTYAITSPIGEVYPAVTVRAHSQDTALEAQGSPDIRADRAVAISAQNQKTTFKSKQRQWTL